MLLLAVAFGLPVAVLVPRTGSAVGRAWPWLATKRVADLVRLVPDSMRREGWQQVKQRVAIAAFKYRYCTAGVWMSALSVASFLAWSIAQG